mgnify:CR=1 FL=1
MAEVTIRDIAQAAGVSAATVSRVLNQKGNVTPQAEARVRAALQQYSYDPRSRQRKKTDRRLMIGLIISDISNNFIIQLIKVVGERVRNQGYSLLVGVTDEDSAKEREYLLLLQKCNAAGIILNTAGGNDELICSISHHTPLVLMNRKIAGASLKCDFIDTDNIAGAEMMTRYLLNLGHTRIGVINGNTCVSTGRERAEGFFQALREIGVENAQGYPYRYEGDYSERTGLYGARYLLEQSPRPTAIVAMNDLIMVGAMKFLLRHKIRVPEDISLIGYGNVSNSELFSVPPHHITQNPVSSGEKAVNCLLERVKTPNLSNREIIFTSSMMEGGSVRPLL